MWVNGWHLYGEVKCVKKVVHDGWMSAVSWVQTTIDGRQIARLQAQHFTPEC